MQLISFMTSLNLGSAERKRKNYSNLNISRKKSFFRASNLPKMFEGLLIEKLMF